MGLGVSVGVSVGVGVSVSVGVGVGDVGMRWCLLCYIVIQGSLNLGLEGIVMSIVL